MLSTLFHIQYMNPEYYRVYILIFKGYSKKYKYIIYFIKDTAVEGDLQAAIILICVIRELLECIY